MTHARTNLLLAILLGTCWTLGCQRQPIQTAIDQQEETAPIPVKSVPGQISSDSASSDSASSDADVKSGVASGAGGDAMRDHFVGSATCASCHPERHASYLQTHHSRSLRLVDVENDPSRNASFEHAASGRGYDVLSQQGRLWHREWKRYGPGPSDRVLANQLPVKYVMGSGAFANGYLLSDGDYLLQSPLTWYAKTDGYAIAPGYDIPNHLGVTRMIDDSCLFCHSGLVSQKDQNPHKPLIHELAIGCERCHGAGQEHTALYRNADGDSESINAVADSQIINPSKLDRLQVESICGQCHLQGDVVVGGADTPIWDFEPGQDLAAIRMHYKNESPAKFDKAFTGHFDQMWQSPCYLQSDTLTCISCHDPHRTAAIEDQVQHRRSQCNQCHADDGCSLPLPERKLENDDNCVACHMPAIDSNIPHTSTTSHLISVYNEGVPRAMKTMDRRLRRLQHTTTLDPEELSRRDAIAEISNAVDQTQSGNFEPLTRYNSEERIRGFLRGDRSDAEILGWTARLSRLRAEALPVTEQNRPEMIRHWDLAEDQAIKVLQLESRPLKSREAALEIVAIRRMAAGDLPKAIECYEELTRVRRVASDSYNLALCVARQGRLADAEELFRKAVQIDGAYAPAYRSLSVLYRSIDPARSQQFAGMADRLNAPPPEQ